MSEKNKETLKQFLIDVWNEGDIDAIENYLAESYTIHHDPGDPWDGQTLNVDGFKERVSISRAPFPDQTFTIKELVAEGDEVVATWHWKGTHLGDIPGFPATDKPITMSGITVYYFDNGRISGHWQVVDRAGVYQQLSQQNQT